jgi:phage terminase small subunit
MTSDVYATSVREVQLAYIQGVQGDRKEIGGGVLAKLTAKQEKYVQGLISGLSQREAYKRAYNTTNWKDESIDQKASVLLKNVKVRSRYDELMSEHKEKALWTREKAVEELLFILDFSKKEIKELGLEASNKGAFIDAVRELNKLEQVYKEPESTRANTELTKAKTQLIKGAEHDTSLMQVLLDVLSGGDAP